MTNRLGRVCSRENLSLVISHLSFSRNCDLPALTALPPWPLECSWEAPQLHQVVERAGVLLRRAPLFVRSADLSKVAPLAGALARGRRQEAVRDGAVHNFEHLDAPLPR